MSQAAPAEQLSEHSGRVASLQFLGSAPELECEGLVDWLDRLLDALRPGCRSLNVRLVPDQEMQRLNRDFRHQDKTTDVLSFPGEKTPEGEHLGDIVIALSVAERQASVARHPLGTELRILALHGVLHCMGYDHEVDDGQMEELEDELRRRWIEPTSSPGAAPS